LEPPLCVVSNWIIKVYTILVWNTISGSSNLDMCCYHCWIFTLIFHLKVLINFFFFIIIIIIINIIIVFIVLLLTIIYTINLLLVRPRSCRVIYYFDTPAFGRRHQSFGRVKNSVLPLRQSKSLINKHLDRYCPTVTVHFWTVTVWPLLIFLTISGIIELRFKRNSWHWKGKTWGYKFYALRRTQFCL
jgi:hypothetical protein